MNYGFNPGLNTPNQGQWPTYEKTLFQKTVRANYAREKGLTEEQATQYKKMGNYWSERCVHYSKTTNYPDSLCEALACRDALNVTTSPI